MTSLVHINNDFTYKVNYFADLVWTLKRLCFLGFGVVDKYRYLLIQNLHDREVWGYRKIAQWLNQSGIQIIIKI